MKKIWVILGLCLVMALGLVAGWQWKNSRAATRRAQAAEAAQHELTRARVEESERQAAAEARAERLQREVQEFSTVTSNLRSNEALQRSNLTALANRLQPSTGPGPDHASNGSGGGLFGKGMGEMLNKMMQDPEMRKMLRGQQKAMVEMMYSGLYKQLRLSSQEQAALNEILLDAQMSQVENAGGMLGGGDGAKDLAQVRQAMDEAKNATDGRVKELLGEERYGEYQDYQKNLGERMQMTQLQSKLEAANLPLQEPQAAQILQLLKEEKTRVPPVLPSGDNVNPAELRRLMTDENLERQMQWQDEYNRRVLERAATVLSPEQLKVYRDYQEQQASMQKLGLKMAKGLFGGSEPAPAATTAK